MTYIGAVAPEALVVNISRGQLAVDFTTVTGGSFQVKLPDGTFATWTAVVSNATLNSLTSTHAYQLNDLSQAGTYVIVPKLTVPGGSIMCRRIVKDYVNPFV